MQNIPKKPINKNVSVKGSTAAKRPSPRKNISANTSSQPRKPLQNQQKRPLKAVKRPISAKKQLKQNEALKKQQSRERFNARIRTQTPANRQSVKSTKKVSGSFKNLEIKRRQSTKKQSFRVKKKNKNMKRLMILGFIIFALIFSMLFGIVAGFVSLSLHSGRSANGEKYYLQIGETAEEDYSNVFELSKDVSQKYGNLYFPVSELMDLCDLTITGEANDLRYSVMGSDSQSMRFIVGTNIAYVNKVLVRMDSPSFISNGKLHIPLNFLTEYSEGLVIDVDEDENYITIFRTVTGKDEKNKPVLADFKFKLGTIEPLIITATEEDYSVSENDEE